MEPISTSVKTEESTSDYSEIIEEERKSPVLIRFKIIEATKKEYEDMFSKNSAYFLIWRKKTIKGFILGAKMLLMLPDIGDWRGQEESNCMFCKDTGVIHQDKGWLPCGDCSLGTSVNKYYLKKRASMPH